MSSLREKCPYLELFSSTFSRIQTEYGPKITPNTDTIYAVLLFVIEKILSKKECFNYSSIILVKKLPFAGTNLIEKSFSLIWVIWAVEEEVNSCFNMPTSVAK